ncbi:hypothetical protein [Helicobacter rodentium]|nr:hypothetical protein [Helicobacter rodentium]
MDCYEILTNLSQQQRIYASLRGEAEAIHNQAQRKTLQWSLYE